MPTPIIVVYKYLAPGAALANEIPITTATKVANLGEVWDLHPEGEIITLEADDPVEYGEGPKEYKVRYRFGPVTVAFGSGESGEPGHTLPTLLIVVTDPDT